MFSYDWVVQYYETDQEVDYVIEMGSDGIWSYRKWKSGIAECWGSLDLTTAIQTKLDSAALYYNDSTMKKVDYPVKFKETPTEIANLQSPAGIVWLAGKSKNSKSSSAVYSLISPDKLSNSTYSIAFTVKGYWQ